MQVLIHGQGIGGSVWFDRGWTLQELVAPKEVVFYGKLWYPYGTRSSIAVRLALVARIYIEILRADRDQIDRILPKYSIAARMSWAAGRQTTRTEDRAYSLLGLFNVNMPLLYGEGQRAFLRLQEEILKVGTDLSILAWSHLSTSRPADKALLADSPECLRDCHTIRRSPRLGHPFSADIAVTMSNVGLQLKGPLIMTTVESGLSGLALNLECRFHSDATKVIGLKLDLMDRQTSVHKARENDILRCTAGWPYDREWQSDRRVFVDRLEAIQRSAWKTITISRNLVSAKSTRMHAANAFTHVWIRFSGVSARRT